jgi:hypothetical protein
MLQEFRRPVWCQEVVVTADAAYTSRANLALIQTLGHWYVMALSRTWKFADGKTVRELVTHLPRAKYTQIRIPNRQHATPSDLLGLCETRAAAPCGRCHSGAQ